MTRLTLDRALPVEVSAEPIEAWRTWALTGKRDGSRMLLRPVAAGSRPWPVGRPAEAICRNSWGHPAPHVGCSCGLHGTHDPDLLRRTRSPAVLGRVAFWGRVIEHELGFRARFGYPQRIRLLCQFCFWLRGDDGEEPSVVGWFPREDLLPMCDDHVEIAARYGMRPHRLFGAGEVEQRLRGAYSVDLLPR